MASAAVPSVLILLVTAVIDTSAAGAGGDSVTSAITRMSRDRDTVIVRECSDTGSDGGISNGDALESVHQTARSVQTICLDSSSVVRRSGSHPRRQLESSASTCLFWFPENAWSRPELTRPRDLLSRWGVECDRLAVLEREKNISQSFSQRLLDVQRDYSVTAVMLGKDGSVMRVFVHHVNCVTETARPLELRRSERRNSSRDLFLKNEISLRGHHLRVVTTAAAGTLFIRFTDDGDEVDGVELNMLEAMSAALGFTFSLQHPRSTDGVFGTRLANGSWTGVIRRIVDGDADLAIGDISTTLLRSTVVDYTYPFHMEPSCLALERPGRLPRWLVIAQPFDQVTWLLLLLSVLAAAAVMATVPGLLPPRWSPTRRLRHALWFTANTLTSQSLFLPAERPVHRAIIALWWLLCLVVSICYRTVLTSTLTIPHYEKPIDSLRALAESSLAVKVADGTAVQLFFRSYAGSDSYLARLVPRLSQFRIEQLSDPNSPLDSDTVYVNELTVLRMFLSIHRSDNFYISRARFFQTGLAWPIRKGACFTPLLNRATLQLLQSGVVHHWMPPLVDEPDAGGTQSLTVVDLSAAFLALSTGLLTAALSLAVERCLGARRGAAEGKKKPLRQPWVVPTSSVKPPLWRWTRGRLRRATETQAA